MPIGKNSIKRVKNNGYSSVKSNAPDMENSTIIANPSPEVIEKMIPSVKEIEKKAAKKPAVKKQTESKTKSAKAKKNTTEKDGYIRFSLGTDLPDYLL